MIISGHSLYEVLFGLYLPNSHEQLTKKKLGQVQVGSNIAQIHLAILHPNSHEKLTKREIR